MPFKEARNFVWKKNFKTVKEWRRFAKSKKKPKLIPYNPDRVYKDFGWLSYPDWIGTIKGKATKEEWLPFPKAREFARSLKLKSQKEWIEWKKNNKEINIPLNVSGVYKYEGYKGLSDFLGYNTYVSYKECEKLAKSLNLKNMREWTQFCKSGSKPKNIPSYPAKFYEKKGWTNWPTFLGNSNNPKNKIFFNYDDAKKIIKKEKLKTRADWYRFVKSGNKPDNIPAHPSRFYKNMGWIDIYDFLSAERPKTIRYLNFENARGYARSLNLKSITEWRQLTKENKIPATIPNSPDNKYKAKGWKGWGDFLGTVNRVPKHKRANFFEAKKIIKKFDLKTNKDWRLFCKLGKRPHNIPSNPDKVYKKHWKGWPDFLGKEKK